MAWALWQLGRSAILAFHVLRRGSAPVQPLCGLCRSSAMDVTQLASLASTLLALTPKSTNRNPTRTHLRSKFRFLKSDRRSARGLNRDFARCRRRQAGNIVLLLVLHSDEPFCFGSKNRDQATRSASASLKRFIQSPGSFGFPSAFRRLNIPPWNVDENLKTFRSTQIVFFAVLAAHWRKGDRARLGVDFDC